MSLTRRTFFQGAAFAAAGLSVSAGVRPRLPRRSPNEEVRVAVIGFRSRGRAHIDGLRRLPGVRVVALCDVDRRVLGGVVDEFDRRGERVDAHVDLREVLDRKDVDAVSIATPNHWHALATVWACQAGKDVYVEKPVSHGLWEGRRMVRAAEKYERIVQVGTQSRSSRAIAEAIAWVRAGNLGKIRLVRGLCYKPRQSIGKVEGPQQVDPAVDYDLWTGPAPLVPLMRKSLHYDWHWVFDTGNGDLGNQGVHQLDIARWVLGEGQLPRRVVSFGGRYGYDDDGETPNTLMAWYDYEVPLLFEVRGLPRDAAAQVEGWSEKMDTFMDTRIGVIVHCEGGHLRIPSYSEANAYDERGRHLLTWKGAEDHFENFIDCVRSRRAKRLAAPIRAGHLSAGLCHMANTSYLRGATAPVEEARERIGRVANLRDGFDRVRAHLLVNGIDLAADPLIVGPWLDLDPETERFTNDEAANELRKRAYREPFVVPRSV